MSRCGVATDKKGDDNRRRALTERKKMKLRYCPYCNLNVDARPKFSWAWFLLLLLVTFFGGLLYLLYYALKPDRCPVCDAVIPATSKRVKQEKHRRVYCLSCGSPVSAGAAYCGRCGVDRGWKELKDNT